MQYTSGNVIRCTVFEYRVAGPRAEELLMDLLGSTTCAGGIDAVECKLLIVYFLLSPRGCLVLRRLIVVSASATNMDISTASALASSATTAYEPVIANVAIVDDSIISIMELAVLVCVWGL
eukprot:IDg14129t1